ncbi:MAG: TIGR00341 family protein [Lentisphaeria bacterium]|nr:TIGR00341 family protein [Lentisphaeria bacterium]NQZ67566.1 TIGR00341 family protein [Lentisphaeria bacterium]
MLFGEHRSVLVLIQELQEAELMTRWGFHFGHHAEDLCFIVCPLNKSDDAAAINKSIKDETENLPKDEFRRIEYRLVKENKHSFKEIQKIIDELDIDILIVSKHQSNQSRELSQQLFEESHCCTMIIRTGNFEATNFHKVLVPVAGGPHSKVALRFLESCIDPETVEINALTIIKDGVEYSREVGERKLDLILKDSSLKYPERIKRRIQVSDDVAEGISNEAGDDYDLVLIGASDTGFIRRALFGTLPPQRLLGESGTAIAVVRSAKPMWARIRESIGSWFDLRIPQLEREDRIALFENIDRNSLWSFDFMMLIFLSTAIAALGLIQNSTAVVIGAMLVAPLMTPILGAGLALVQANLPMMIKCARSILYGFLTAFFVALFLGLLSPMSSLNSELLARGGPNLLDLLIAFLSGLAAAHCIARPNLSAALPGVAIAAALVPPIATTGISLAIGEYNNAAGAALLFTINVIAIVLGAALCFYAGGIRSHNKDSLKHWVNITLVSLVLLSAVMAIPLGSVLYSNFRVGRSNVKLQKELHVEIKKIIQEQWDAELISIQQSHKKDSHTFIITVSADHIITADEVKEFSDVLSKDLSKDLQIKVRTILESSYTREKK